MVTEQASLPEQAPPHPAKADPPVPMAYRLTSVFCMICEEHGWVVVVQANPPASVVIVPVPVPLMLTDKERVIVELLAVRGMVVTVESGSFEVIKRFWVKVPAGAAEKVTWMSQVPSGGINTGRVPQVPVPSEKLPPPAVIPVITRLAMPSLEIMKDLETDEGPL